MNKRDAKREIEYRLSLMMLQSLLEQNKITEEQFAAAKQELIQMYNPVIGGLDLGKVNNSNSQK